MAIASMVRLVGILFAVMLAVEIAPDAALAEQAYPELAWGSYLGEGGDSMAGYLTGYACDAAGNMYVVRTVEAGIYPAQEGLSSAYAGGTDVYIAKISAAGKLEWGTYLGGTGDETVVAKNVHMDSRGNLIIAGSTTSADFPTVNAFDATPGENTDIFVAKVTPEGEIAWSSYLSGNSYDEAYTTALDGSDNLFILGVTANDFPVKGGFDRVPSGGMDCFLAKITPSGKLAWSTFVGDDGAELLLPGWATVLPDRSGCAYVVVTMSGGTFPAARAFNSVPDDAGMDVYVARVTPSGQLAWGAFLGGSFNEAVWEEDVHLDSAGNLVLVGSTTSGDFPSTAGFQGHAGGIWDIFVAKVTPRGRLAWARCLGGSDWDWAHKTVLSRTDDLFIIGSTRSTDFPTPDGFDTEHSPQGDDCFVTKVTPSGQLAWSSFVGEANRTGVDPRKERAAIVDNDGNLFLAMCAAEGTYPTPGGFDTEYTDRDVYLAMITASGQLAWGTFIGGSGIEGLNWSSTPMHFDPAGNIILTGATNSMDFLAAAGLEAELSYVGNQFVVVVTPQGELNSATFLGCAGGFSFFDPLGNMSFFGWTSIDDFPTDGGFNATFGTAPNACVARIHFADEAFTSISPEDCDVIDAATPPAFAFQISPKVANARIAFSTTADFPKKPVKRDDGQWNGTVRFRLAPGAVSWSPSPQQWQLIKRIARPDATLYWRLEGTMDRTFTATGPSRWATIAGE